MSVAMVIRRRATIRRLLRSKREMISPVSPAEKASGLTSTSVRSIAARDLSGCSPSAARGLAAGRRLAERGLVGARLGGPAPPGPVRLGRSDLGLAVGAQAPARLERAPARVAALLEPA